MKRYRVIAGVLRLPAGHRLELGREQIGLRAHNLTLMPGGADSDGWAPVEAKAAVEFKAGEVIGLSAVPKALAGQLLALEPDKTADGLRRRLQAAAT